MDSTSTILTPRDRLLIFLSLLILIVQPFAADSYTPSLPAIAKALSVRTDQIQLTMTFYLFGASFSQLIYGPIADRHGRKPIILTGIIIAIIGSALCAVANSLIFILLARLIQGVGAGVCNALFKAVMRDSFSGSKMSQAGSYAGMFFTVAYAAAPILGGYIQFYFGWRANFIFAFILISVIFILLILYMPETHLKKDATATQMKNILRNYFSLIASPIFIGYTCISSLAFSGIIAYYTAAPFILQNVAGLTPVEFGWLSLGLGAGIFIGQYWNAKKVVTQGVMKLLETGLWIMLASGSAMLIAGMLGFLNTYVIIIPVIFFCISAGLVFSNTMSKAFHPFGHIAGVAGAMYGFIQILGSALTSILVATLHENTQVPLAMVFTGLGIVALLIFYLLRFVKESE